MRPAWIIVVVAACGSSASPAPVAPPAAVSVAAPVGAQELRGAQHVTFPSHDADLTHGAPTTIDGWLFAPPGAGPHPAIVALHGCAGLFGKGGDLSTRHRDWAERLAALGYVVLMPDSYGPRGFTEVCSHDVREVRPDFERTRDAYGALAYLAARPDVDPARIGLLGWSNGGSTVLHAIASKSRARPEPLAHDFRIAIAFYPGCDRVLARHGWMPPTLPVHILIGASDDWTPAAPCSELVDRVRAAGGAADIVVYPDAFHDFDDPVMPVHMRKNVATTATGTATIGMNPSARADSIERVTRLLRAALGDAD